MNPQQPTISAPPADRSARQFDLVALDLDGTLLRSDKNITQRTARVIRRVSGLGVKVVLCSARPPRSVREIHEQLGLDTPQINYNGALIHDRLTGRHITHQPLEQQMALRIVRLARQMDHGIDVSVELLDTLRTDRPRPTIATETSKRFQPDLVGPIETIIDQPVTKVMLLAHAQRLVPVRQAVAQTIGNQAGLMQSDQTLLQYVHPTVNKGRALASVAESYGIAQDRVLAIGDAPNDIPMLEWAGLSVAVENAWPETRHIADHLLPSNDNEGVARALHKWVLAD